MENNSTINIQKQYLFLKKINQLHELGYRFVTYSALEKNLKNNLDLWSNLDKVRKVSDKQAFINGTLSELYGDKYLERLDKGEYRISAEGKDFLHDLYETLADDFNFEFTSIDNELSEEETYEAIILNKQFAYHGPEHLILTSNDIAELALTEFQNNFI